jgi:hypothetical protein
VANLEKFSDWLKCELEKRKWSYRELARRAGKNASYPKISLTIAGKRAITWDFCVAIAEPLGYSPIEVFKIAGLLPEEEAAKQ